MLSTHKAKKLFLHALNLKLLRDFLQRFAFSPLLEPSGYIP